jgi:hypothetical protein
MRLSSHYINRPENGRDGYIIGPGCLAHGVLDLTAVAANFDDHIINHDVLK